MLLEGMDNWKSSHCTLKNATINGSICPQSHFNTIWHKVMLIVRILCIHLISHKNGSALEWYFLCGDVSGITDWSWYSPISAMERGAINSVSPLELDMLYFESHFALKHTKVFLLPLYFFMNCFNFATRCI